MKIIIAGGREVTDYQIVRNAIIESGYWRRYGRSIEVISGMALHWKWKDDPVIGGVDRWGYEFAKRNGLHAPWEFPADWSKGKVAGMLRNAKMGRFAKEHGGRLLAVWDGKSSGTKDMIGWADDNKLPYYVWLYNQNRGYEVDPYT